MASPSDELLSLDEKLDFANAAAAELDVVAFDGDLAVPPVGLNASLHRMNVGNRRVIEIFAPDEREQVLEKCIACLKVAGTRPRLNERGSFPVLTDAFVIAQRRQGRHGDLGRCGIGA